MDSNSAQDIAMWVTMGPVADRTRDRLGASDRAIIEFRNQMVDAVRAFQQGKPAIGTGADCIPAEVCAFQAMVPKTYLGQGRMRFVDPAGGTEPITV